MYGTLSNRGDLCDTSRAAQTGDLALLRARAFV